MDDTATILTIIFTSLSIVIAITTIFSLISRSIKRSFKATMKAENDKQAKELKAEFTNSLKALADELARFKDDKNSSDEKLKNASLASARDRIHQAYTYFIPRGTIDEHTLFCIVELAKAYGELGGNTFVKDEVKELQHMYTESLKHKEKQVHED